MRPAGAGSFVEEDAIHASGTELAVRRVMLRFTLRSLARQAFSRVALLSFAATVASAPGIAHACSDDPCPDQLFALPREGAKIPVNAPALAFWSDDVPTLTKTGDDGGPITLERISDGAASPRLYRPVAGLVAGASYRFDVALTCPSQPGRAPVTVQTSFTVAEASPLPTSLGTLTTKSTRGPLRIGSGAGGCYEDVDAAQLALELAPSDSARPWLDALDFETLVDGKPWKASADIRKEYHPAGSWQGFGRDVVFTKCEESRSTDEGVEEGKHTVVLQARLPGSGTVLATDPVLVELRCATSSEAPAAAGGDAPNDGLDAEEARPQSRTGGCAQAAPTNVSTTGGALASLALGIMLLAGRRRR